MGALCLEFKFVNKFKIHLAVSLWKSGIAISAFKETHGNDFKDAFLYLLHIAGIFIANLFEMSKYLSYLLTGVLRCLKKVLARPNDKSVASVDLTIWWPKKSSCLFYRGFPFGSVGCSSPASAKIEFLTLFWCYHMKGIAHCQKA